MNTSFGEMQFTPRMLLGAGPSNVHPRVLRAMSSPLLGYLDPDFVEVMDDVQTMLHQVFRLRNGFAFPVSGTGGAGMEAAIANATEPGDVVIIAANGFFSQRLAEMAQRHGGIVELVEIPWGETVTTEALEGALQRHRQVKLVTVVHAETSTGVLTPLPDLADLVHRYGALFLVDAVTSLGGSELDMDAWGIDICYSASQKCIGAPPGLAPLAINDQAMEVIRSRKQKPHTWYLDLSLLERYWSAWTGNSERVYHHTAPISMIYGLREALRLILEQGLEARQARHKRNAQALRAGLQAMGLQLLVEHDHWTPQITTVGIPSGVNDIEVRHTLLRDYNIEIGGALGEFKGTAWRIGLMGESSTYVNVLGVLSVLEITLNGQGFETPTGAGVSAAQRVLTETA